MEFNTEKSAENIPVNVHLNELPHNTVSTPISR